MTKQKTNNQFKPISRTTCSHGENCNTKKEGCKQHSLSIQKIKTKEEARSMAIEFQTWVSENNLSYAEISHFQGFFEILAKKFNLIKEFKENGII